MSSELSAAEIEAYRGHIGRSLVETDQVCADVIARIGAALDRGWSEAALPPMWHYGLFLPATPTGKLGPDGHPPRGEFFPAVRLQRRMFAGSNIRFIGDLAVGHPAERRCEIAAVDHRRGRSGELVFVRVKVTVTQQGTPRIEEEQTIVYRSAGPATAAVRPAALPALPSDASAETWTPTPVELFRFSAVTFNAHRIHYDRPYATEGEGYPDLVVHGPLTAIRLCDFAGRVGGRRISRFTFRGEAPTFVNQPVRLVARPHGGALELHAERADGAPAMSATAAFD